MKAVRRKTVCEAGACAATPVAGRMRNRRKQGGVATLEFALIAPVLFLLLCIAMDLGVALWVNLTMQYAVREGARYSVTGQSNLDPSATNQQRYEAVLQEIKVSSMGLYNYVSPSYVITINGGTSQTYSTQANYSAGMFGNPGDIVVLQINCIWPMLTPLIKPFFANGKFSFSVAATMRNEGF
ncbi:TadE/TadG family type IV pilus assembly protein [Paraburkholderia sp. BL21I4N1]|uniref:TadE/TadG family type IV pilus assembly protein n=1 Tax=Paraburkholderia sp. BL21I4N1 TaxID=1938801 RepID=UPI000CFA92AB|nr:TadE/TadG family type IV pilus assembly protein [Paraburkholderia sp. BL21I4N1]PQV54589.1 Flp pilus assembly protein TadG [Paraburkholderia sp. BL21I4N1]